MLKKIIQISYLSLISALLIGCTVSHKAPTCDQLKRQWLYNNTNLNNENFSPAQREKLQKQMQENNCY